MTDTEQGAAGPSFREGAGEGRRLPLPDRKDELCLSAGAVSRGIASPETRLPRFGTDQDRRLAKRKKVLTDPASCKIRSAGTPHCHGQSHQCNDLNLRTWTIYVHPLVVTVPAPGVFSVGESRSAWRSSRSGWGLNREIRSVSTGYRPTICQLLETAPYRPISRTQVLPLPVTLHK